MIICWLMMTFIHSSIITLLTHSINIDWLILFSDDDDGVVV